MGVKIEDVGESTTGTISINIPDGRHDYMLVGLTCVYQEWWLSGPEITRGTPSGGGGSWVAVDDEISQYSYEYGSYRVRMYSWYSYPTQRGSVSLDTGSFYTDGGTGDQDGRYSVFYSLSNAKFYEGRTVPETSSIVENFRTMRFSKQGSCAFGMVSSVGAITGQYGPYGTSTLGPVDRVITNTYSQDIFTAHDYHRQYRSAVDARRYSQPGIDFNTSVFRTAGVFISADSVSCSH